MEETSIMNITTYSQLRAELNAQLTGAAVSFVRIGYLLKLARDEDLLKDSGYSDVNEFAEKEFGIDKTQVSRFIRINDRFSIGGYSEQLEDKYSEYGSAKLSLMLTLPDEINEELSPEFSKSDIQAIKEDYEEEQKISDIEVMLEEKDEDAPDEFIAMIIKQLNDEHPEPAKFFKETIDMAEKMGVDVSVADIKEDCYCAAGDAAYNIRIPGQGRFMISMKDDGITILNMRTMEKSPLSWQEFLDVSIADVKGRIFEDPEPEKSKEVKKPEKKPEKAKVQKSKKPEKKQTENTASLKKDEASKDSEKELPFPEGTEPEITHVSPDDPLPEEPEKVEGEVVKILTKRELERIANDLRSLADQFDAGTGGDLYDNPIEELEGMKNEIRALPEELIPVIEGAIKQKESIKQ